MHISFQEYLLSVRKAYAYFTLILHFEKIFKHWTYFKPFEAIILLFFKRQATMPLILPHSLPQINSQRGICIQNKISRQYRYTIDEAQYT